MIFLQDDRLFTPERKVDLNVYNCLVFTLSQYDRKICIMSHKAIHILTSFNVHIEIFSIRFHCNALQVE